MLTEKIDYNFKRAKDYPRYYKQVNRREPREENLIPINDTNIFIVTSTEAENNMKQNIITTPITYNKQEEQKNTHEQEHTFQQEWKKLAQEKYGTNHKPKHFK